MIPERFQRRAEVVRREVEGEVLLFDPRTGALHVLNPSGALLWELLASARSAAELEQALGDAFEVAAGDDLAGDLARILADLQARGLVAPVR